jgi:hypothetical protein
MEEDVLRHAVAMENFTAQSERHPLIHIRKWKKMFYVTLLRVRCGGSPNENEIVVSKLTENFTAPLMMINPNYDKLRTRTLM